MSAVSFRLVPEYSQLCKDKSDEIYLMGEFSASPLDEGARIPLALSAVLDVSGSMQGPKIDALKKTMKKLVKNLTSDDHLGIVAFSSDVREVLQATKMDEKGKKKANDAIDALMANGGTNMSGGISRSFQQFKDMDLPAVKNPKNRAQAIEIENAPISVKYVKRMMVFTDGQANEGIHGSDHNAFTNLVESNMGDISISSFGYGGDHDAALLNVISGKGKGSFYYIQNEDDMSSSFARELGGIVSCIAQNLSIKLETNGKVEISEVVSDNFKHELLDKKQLKIEIPDIYAEEKMRILIKVKIPEPSKAITERGFKLAKAKASCLMVKNAETVNFDEKCQVEFGDKKDDKPNADVAECVILLTAGKTSREALKMVQSGNASGGIRLMQAWASSQDMADYARSGGSEALYACAASDIDSVKASFSSDLKGIVATSYATSLSRQRTAGTRSASYFTKSKTQKDMEKKFDDKKDDDKKNP